MTRHILIILFAFTFSHLALAQVRFSYPSNHSMRYIHPGDQEFSLAAETMLWIDADNQEPNLEEIHQTALKDEFSLWPETLPQWNQGHDYWMRLHVYNSSHEARRWVIHLGEADWATVWLLHEKGGAMEVNTGEKHEFSNDNWLDRNGEVSIPVSIPGRKALTVYARLSNQGANPPLVAPFMQTEENWQQQRQKEYYLQMGILCAFLLALAVNLPALIWQRKRSHIFFMLFALLVSTWMLHDYGYLRMHFLLGVPTWNWEIGVISLIFAQPLFLLFAYEQLEEKPPVLQLWVGVRISLSLALLTLALLRFPIPLEWAMRAFWIFDALILAYCSLNGRYPIMQEGFIQDRWTLGSGLWLYLCLLTGTLLSNMSQRWGMPLGQPYDLYAYQIGGLGAFLMYVWSTLKYTMTPKIKVYQPLEKVFKV